MGGKRLPLRSYKKSESYPAPRTKELGAETGTSGFWRTRIPGFHVITRPFYNLLKKNAVWARTPPREEALELLKANVNVYQSLGPFHPLWSLSLHIRVGEMGYWWDYVDKDLPAPRSSNSW